jgi:two-component system response regulator HydG
MASVLLADANSSSRRQTREVLERANFQVVETDDLNALAVLAERHNPQCAIITTRIKADIAQLRHVSHLPVLVLNDYTNLRVVVESMKAGVAEYLVRPVGDEAFLGAVEAMLDVAEAVTHSAPRDSGRPTSSRNDFFQGGCHQIKSLVNDINKVAATNATVLILGETGTGKELAARRVHELSSRKNRPMVTVNCAAIPDTLIESELFGYEKGAFTGATADRIGLIEAAQGGTLFLDEIGELPLAAQARLLRFIQEGEVRRIGSVTSKQVDVRLLCATHRELSELASRDEFRQDLYFRINVLRLEIPPLRTRGEDIDAMAYWFIDRICHQLGCAPRSLSDDAMSLIHQYSWPGNVRELQHALERAVVMGDGPKISAGDLGIAPPVETSTRPRVVAMQNTPRAPQAIAPESTDDSEELSLEDYFQRFVLEHQDNMNETELAQKLGISRKCLWERRQRFDIPRKRRSKRRLSTK